MADTRLNAVIPKIIATKLIAKRFIALNILQVTNRSTISSQSPKSLLVLALPLVIVVDNSTENTSSKNSIVHVLLSETFPSDGLGFIYWRSSLDCYGNVFTIRSIDTALQVGRASDETVTFHCGSRATRTSEWPHWKLQTLPLVREGALHGEADNCRTKENLKSSHRPQKRGLTPRWEGSTERRSQNQLRTSSSVVG
jgi:hypothetical protein